MIKQIRIQLNHSLFSQKQVKKFWYLLNLNLKLIIAIAIFIFIFSWDANTNTDACWTGQHTYPQPRFHFLNLKIWRLNLKLIIAIAIFIFTFSWDANTDACWTGQHSYKYWIKLAILRNIEHTYPQTRFHFLNLKIWRELKVLVAVAVAVAKS